MLAGAKSRWPRLALIVRAVLEVAPVTWLDPAFVSRQQRVDVVSRHHLRPIREDDVEIDDPAVMGSRRRPWEMLGDAWTWPF
jgi:hypothetical protein